MTAEMTDLEEVIQSPDLECEDLLSGRLDRITACLDEYTRLSDLFDEPEPDRYEAIGRRVSDLPVARSLRRDDLFLLAQEDGKTRALEYSTLLGQLSSDILDKAGVKSMAFEDKDKYSKIDHVHDNHYNRTHASAALDDGVLICEIGIGPDGQEDPGGEGLKNPFRTGTLKLSCPSIL